ncbi:MAG TPA: histidine phosphatase family protein [Friedmanniella sp.]
MAEDPGATAPSTRRLVLLRHAKSSWADDLPDLERPLSARGRRDAAEAGHWLAAHVGRPDLVLCSTAVRTRQTWARAGEAEPDLLGPAQVRFEAAIYAAWPDTLLELARRLPVEVTTAVLVGHAPGLPDLAERLNRANGDRPVGDFPTSAVATFAVSGAWGDLGPGSAALTAYAVPRG